MNDSRRLWHPLTLLVVVGGPATIGAALGMRAATLRQMLFEAIAVPGIAVGLSLLMIPALYIAASMMNLSPSAERTGASAADSLRASGTLLLGLAPAMMFLLATARSNTTIALLGLGVFLAGTLVGIRALFLGLFASCSNRGRALVVFVPWAAVWVLLGTHLFCRSLDRTFL